MKTSLSLLLLFGILLPKHLSAAIDSTKIDRVYALEATMLGFFAKDGTRNPTLRANKGDRVRIIITNGENMTHDVAMENAGVKSETIFEKGSQTSITFLAINDDTYYCTVPGHRAAGMLGDFKVVEGEISDKTILGILPEKKGKVLNLGFETGDLRDWTATGNAFTEPVFDAHIDKIHAPGTQIGFDGQYFLSSGGTLNHQLTGTLQSTLFKVTHPFVSFKVSGGALHDTRVELVLSKTKEVIFSSTGQGRATLQPVVADLNKHLGKEIFIRIVDNETGVSPISYIGKDTWAHINLDDFRFHKERPFFQNELKPSDIIILPPLDPIINSGLSGVEAAKVMDVPEGFTIKLAAAEPDIIRPISFTIDARGRLWVVEGHTYPTPAKEGEGKDRILIFEDTNGDGTLDKRKVFAEGLNLVSGIEVGMGGVWLGAAPYLLFIPVNYETDKPAGPPQKLLDGWGTQDTHEVLNNLRWGPDGWLYGCHGVFTHSNVGKPGSSDSERQKINGGVWRYHPTRHVFEVFAEGTSNPWGIDFNEYGHTFITVCVIPHMYHITQGGRYQRQAGKHFNPYTFDDIKTIGDHVHYLGDRGPHAGNFRSAAAGGGHAHSGAMIYLGGDSWPSKYRNQIFMNNINGARMNIDQLTPSGSGYKATHEKDFIVMNDSWSQWLNFKYDPSGSVYAIDWYDQNQCHSPNPDVHDKSLGRIFKISYKTDQWSPVNLYQATNLELVQYQLHNNEWYVRQARTLLQERAGNNPEVISALKEILHTHPDIIRKLRALWTLHVLDGLTEKDLNKLLENSNEHLRSWSIQLLAENKKLSSATVEKFEELAKNEPSPMVRLYLSSATQRLPLADRWEILSNLVQREEDSSDQNLPLMLWYAAEPLADLNSQKALELVEQSYMPKILLYMIQKVGSIKTEESRKQLEKLKVRLNTEAAHSRHMELESIEKILSE